MRGKHVIKRRRDGALERLQASQFFEKGKRTEAQWQKRKDKEIEILETYLGIRQPARKKQEFVDIL